VGATVKRKDVQRLAHELCDGVDELRNELAMRDAQVQVLAGEVARLRAEIVALNTCLWIDESVADMIANDAVEPGDSGDYEVQP
jgi:hypothetical protein